MQFYVNFGPESWTIEFRRMTLLNENNATHKLTTTAVNGCPGMWAMVSLRRLGWKKSRRSGKLLCLKSLKKQFFDSETTYWMTTWVTARSFATGNQWLHRWRHFATSLFSRARFVARGSQQGRCLTAGHRPIDSVKTCVTNQTLRGGCCFCLCAGTKRNVFLKRNWQILTAFVNLYSPSHLPNISLTMQSRSRSLSQRHGAN